MVKVDSHVKEIAQIAQSYAEKTQPRLFNNDKESIIQCPHTYQNIQNTTFIQYFSSGTSVHRPYLKTVQCL